MNGAGLSGVDFGVAGFEWDGKRLAGWGGLMWVGMDAGGRAQVLWSGMCWMGRIRIG